MNSILFVQNGDFEEAYIRLSGGGPETYRDQKASVDFVAGLAPKAKVTTVAFGSRTYRTEVAPELWAIGLSREILNSKSVSYVFDLADPSHLVLRTPHILFLREAKRRNVPVLASFADIFYRKGLRDRYRNWQLRRALLACQTPCFSNHSLNASRSLVHALRLPAERVVPWDWTKVPQTESAKFGVAQPDELSAFFAGTLSTGKGVGDCLEAIARLRADGIILTMSFAGPGEIGEWQARAESLGISDFVKFLGVIPNADVRVQMRKHDFVIVPSRHSYAEGLPNTIYEGLASSSPLVISDHPAFAGRLRPDDECLVFSAANPASLAACLKRAALDSDLYRRLSENASFAHEKLYFGMEWTKLISAFLNDPGNDTDWVSVHSLKTLDV